MITVQVIILFGNIVMSKLIPHVIRIIMMQSNNFYNTFYNNFGYKRLGFWTFFVFDSYKSFNVYAQTTIRCPGSFFLPLSLLAFTTAKVLYNV